MTRKDSRTDSRTARYACLHNPTTTTKDSRTPTVRLSTKTGPRPEEETGQQYRYWVYRPSTAVVSPCPTKAAA